MMGNQASFRVEPDTDVYVETGDNFAGATMQGWRRSQEDRFTCISDFHEGFSFYAVYDGHGGSEVAEYLERRFHIEIEDYLESGDEGSIDIDSDRDVELALHSAFQSFDASLKDPEIIAELNEIIEDEDQGSGSDLRFLRDKASLEAAVARFHRDKNRDEAGPSDQSSTTKAGPGDKPTTAVSKNSDKKTTGSTSAAPPTTGAGPSRLIPNFLRPKNMEVDKPLDFLLTDDIEASDSNDEDFDIDEDSESSSSEEDEEMTSISREEFMSQEPGYFSGSTATVAIVGRNKVYVANVGDSRCVLCRRNEAVDMSVDHHPENPEERARIIAADCTISNNGRIDNCLNLSRAFGDFKYKNSSLQPEQQAITAEPHIQSVDITDDDDFLVIASDGIWNSMSSQEVVDFISGRLRDGDCKLEDICEEIFHLTIAENSDNDGSGCDNMTCIIVKFDKGDS